MNKNLFYIVFFLAVFPQFLRAQTAPVARDDANSTYVNSTLVEPAPGVLKNDADADSDPLSVQSFAVNGVVYKAGQSANLMEGEIRIYKTGSYLFFPAFDFTGAYPIISYTITDGIYTSTANLRISVLLAPTPPIARNDFDTTYVHTELIKEAPGLLANDTDANNDVLEVTKFLINGTTYNAGQTANFSEGTISILNNGSYTFVSVPEFVGSVAEITYFITDGKFTSAANLKLTVEVAPQPPDAKDDFDTTYLNTTLTKSTPGLLGNDSDPDNDALVVTEYEMNGVVYKASEIDYFSEGDITISTDGSYIFHPAPNFLGDIPEIRYTITDGTFNSSAKLNISVVLPPEPPLARDDFDTTFVSTPLIKAPPGILINDTDENGDVLEVIEFVINGVSYNSNQTADIAEGTVSIFENGNYQLIPAPEFKGDFPEITYNISDGIFTSSAKLNLFVLLPPEPPIAKDDYDTADLNTTLNVPAPGVFVNDTDANEDDLNVTSFVINGSNYTVGQTAILAEGEFTFSPDGSYTFVPTADYLGEVPPIRYTISDGTFEASATLFLSVEPTEDLLEINFYSSCNQGYTVNGEYKIRYSISLRNKSNAKDFHEPSFIQNIDFLYDFDAIFGNGCAIKVDEVSIRNSGVTQNYVNKPYPKEFTNASLNQNFLDTSSNSLFNDDAISNLTLYPRQTMAIDFCVTINPFCNGRPNPTPSGSGIEFDNIITVNTNRGTATDSIILTDFHTTEAVIAAGLYIPEFNNITLDPPGVINPDGTYDYVNTVILRNEGNGVANDINFNMGLGHFIDRGISFRELRIVQTSGPDVTINPDYDGLIETELLLPNNTLPAGEKITLEIYYLIEPISITNYSYFYQINTSQTQGGLDGYDESTATNKRRFSFVRWSDGLGDHVDRYYYAGSATANVSSESQCSCTTTGMRFLFSNSSEIETIISEVNEAPNGILEQEELTFQITIKNTSESVQLDNLQIQDNLSDICGGNVLSVSTPIISSSTATLTPDLNPNFNGTTDINIFNGTSGVLQADETITVEFTVVLNQACNGINTATFTSTNPLNGILSTSDGVNVNAITDSDDDGTANDDDIDDDNDTILDIEECNGLNPTGDDDADFIPNYRDTDFGVDANGDGVVDLFDFDGDGVPNHFDLDSDNDGILDIVEAGNSVKDTNNNGKTNSAVGSNGFDNTLENNDTLNAITTYSIPNTDGNGNPNYLDIDADGDGIVDNIEAQRTDSYIAPSGTIASNGIDTAYTNGISPIDTDNDGIFDFLDINSDNDIRDDILEGWDVNSDGTAEIIASNIDQDNDGLDDAFDNNNNLVNPSNGQTPFSFPNADNADTDERDWREIIAIVILINDVTEIEGADFLFTINLVTKNNNAIFIESAFPIDLNISTTDGTENTDVFDVATAPFDYNGISNVSITIPAFTTSTSFTIPSLDDTIFELDELFTLNAEVTSNNTINNVAQAIGTIRDNELPPSFSISNSIANEGEDLLHFITLSHPSSTPVDINVNTRDHVAINPEDYIAMSESISINGTIDPNNANTQTSFSIRTNTDNLNESDEETLFVRGVVASTNTSNQEAEGVGTIIDIDPNPLVTIDNVVGVEGTSFLFTIRLLNENLELMQNYLPINITLETVDNTTFAGEDYQPESVFTNIPAFTSSITQTIQTIDDKLNEETETFFLQLSAGGFNTSNTSFPIFGVGTIKDNDYPNLFSPNGDGKSDLFNISGLEDYPDFKLIIVNRLGNEVYNYSNNGRTYPIWWNGYYKGKPAPVGVYFYTLDYNDGVTKPITSFIQLIR